MLNPSTNILQLPDAIVGDLDSLLPHVGTFYESRGVKVITDPDQGSTDFGKCLNYISRYSALQPPDFTETHDALDNWRGVKVSATHSQLAVVALGGFGGRVDQSLHSVCFPLTQLEVRLTYLDPCTLYCLRYCQGVLHSPRALPYFL